MARLYRPHIPVKTHVLVAVRQCYERGFNPPARDEGESLGALLKRQLQALATSFGCEVSELRFDHDPALGLRKRRGKGKKTIYTPHANDPRYLSYRPHGTQYVGSHDVKTRIRGDHGQYSDIVLIKRERRRQKKAKAKTTKVRPKKSRKIQSRGFPKKKRKFRNG